SPSSCSARWLHPQVVCCSALHRRLSACHAANEKDRETYREDPSFVRFHLDLGTLGLGIRWMHRYRHPSRRARLAGCKSAIQQTTCLSYSSERSEISKSRDNRFAQLAQGCHAPMI